MKKQTKTYYALMINERYKDKKYHGKLAALTFSDGNAEDYNDITVELSLPHKDTGYNI